MKREKAKLYDITRQKALLKEINDRCERKTSPLVSATSIPGADQSRLYRIKMDGEVGGQPCTCLIDTGAEISVISQHLASRAVGHKVPSQYTPHTVDGLTGLGKPLLTNIDLLLFKSLHMRQSLEWTCFLP